MLNGERSMDVREVQLETNESPMMVTFSKGDKFTEVRDGHCDIKRSGMCRILPTSQNSIDSSLSNPLPIPVVQLVALAPVQVQSTLFSSSPRCITISPEPTYFSRRRGWMARWYSLISRLARYSWATTNTAVPTSSMCCKVLRGMGSVVGMRRVMTPPP